LFISKETIDKYFKCTINSESGTKLYDLCLKYINNSFSGCSKIEIEYLTSQKSIVNTLMEYPAINTFVFCVLYNRLSPFSKRKDKDGFNPILRTEEIWAFTKEYVTGLHELAKNIVEHSDTHQGMITVRVYEDKDIKEREYFDTVLETHVFDYGDIGIVEKLKNDTEKLIGLGEIYYEDYRILCNSFKMKDYIKPKVINKLQQQLYRDLAHYGLMKFYNLIENNEGIVVSSTNGQNGERDNYYSPDRFKLNTISIGTSYYFELPFKADLFKVKDYVGKSIDMQGSTNTISGLSELMNFLVINDKNELNIDNLSDAKVLLDYKPIIDINNRNDEAVFFSCFKVLKDNKSVKYLAVDFKNISISSSSLLRLLAHISSNYTQSVIVYNLYYNLYYEMLGDNERYLQALCYVNTEMPYWYQDKCIVIYSLFKDVEFNFADILYGSSKAEFTAINYCVSHTFPNANSIINEDGFDAKDFEVPNCLKPIFYKSSLLPFDLLLSNEENKTIFQSNLELLLGQELTVSNQNRINDLSTADRLKSYIKTLDGYKICNTHFRIGSKIHSSDFYYAKRLFQNSYYTARIAIMLSIQIKEKLDDKKIELTLVGYEMYSELLLSLTKKFLNDFGYININHIVTIDHDGQISHLPKNAKVHSMVIIVVPIASTGSTALKIYDYLRNNKHIIFPLPHYNVLLALDNNAGIFKVENRTQTSLVTLKTKWYSPASCELCFNDELSKPIYETDKSSLTPTLIFDLPSAKKILNDDLIVKFDEVIFENALLYRKAKRNDEHFLFSTVTDILIENNKR
jgi:hypothetical protein